MDSTHNKPHLLRKSVYSAWRMRPVRIIMVWKHWRSIAQSLQSVAAATHTHTHILISSWVAAVFPDQPAEHAPKWTWALILTAESATLTLDSGSPLAVVQNGELAKHFARRQRAEVLVLPWHLDTTLWNHREHTSLLAADVNLTCHVSLPVFRVTM
jgi:hypothetical protein